MQLPEFPDAAGEWRFVLGNFFGMLGKLRDYRDRLGVIDDPINSLGRVGLIHRHHHRTGRPQRIVNTRPLIARGADKCHPLTGADVRTNQPSGNLVHLIKELPGRNILPTIAFGHRKKRRIGREFDSIEQQ